jgi:chromosome segregation ATPase
MVDMPAESGSEAKTTIDSLVELLRSRGKTELGKLAPELGVDPAVVESWCKVLEEGRMCKISYEMGRMYVEPISLSKEEEKYVKAKLGSQAAVLEGELAAQRAQLDKLSQVLEAVKGTAGTAELVFKQRMPEIEGRLAGMNRIQLLLDEKKKNLETAKSKAEDTYVRVSRDIADLLSKVEKVSSIEGQTGSTQSLAKVDELVQRARAVEATLTAAQNERQKAIEGMRESIHAQLSTMDRELDEQKKEASSRFKTYVEQIERMVRDIESSMKDAKKVEEQISAFKKRKQSIDKELNDAMTSFNDQYAKIYEAIGRSESGMRGDVEEAQLHLTTIRDAYGEASKIYAEIKSSESDVVNMQKRIDEVRKEIAVMTNELRAIEAAKDMTTEKREERVIKLQERAKKTKAKAEKTKKGVEQAKKDSDKMFGEGEEGV